MLFYIIYILQILRLIICFVLDSFIFFKSISFFVIQIYLISIFILKLNFFALYINNINLLSLLLFILNQILMLNCFFLKFYLKRFLLYFAISLVFKYYYKKKILK